MKASILIVSYNQEATIGRAIESVLNQKCSHDFEIVIADDGSTDSTRRIALEYAERYPGKIRMLPEEANKGIVGNYFDALLTCSSDYIGDCAGDDEWLDETRLQRQIDMLDADKSLTAVFTDVETRRVFPDGRFEDRKESDNRERQRWLRERVPGKEILLGVLDSKTMLPYILSAALYRRDSLMDVYERSRDVVRMPEAGIEDLPVIAALATKGDAAYLPLMGLRYYNDGESLSNNLSFEKELMFNSRVARAVLKIARRHGVDLRLLRDYINTKLGYMASQARHSGNPTLAKEVRDCAREWGVRLPLRARVHFGLLKLGVTR